MAERASTDTGQSRSNPASAGSASSSPAPEEWVDRHGDYLFRYALIRVRNESVAEDLVQETLLAAFKATDRFTSGASERGWLTGILKHKILDHFRRTSRESTLNEDDALPRELADRFDEIGQWRRHPAAGPADWGEDAAALMERKEFMVALRECLSKLPPKCADAFVLREMEAEASDQIQEALHISASNFWVLLYRARMQLRLCLEKNWVNV